MTYSQSGYVIRDAVSDDVEACLKIDHTYISEYVWQMTTQKSPTQSVITFRQERLPRAIEKMHDVNQLRLIEALAPSHCFLVVVERGSSHLWAYLTMRGDAISGITTVQNLVVDTPYRRHGIGRKLLGIARYWAIEHDYQQLMVEVQTKHYPMIQLVQGHGMGFCGYNDQYYSDQDIAIFFGQSLR